jgi:hypothetical protein
LRCGVRSLEEEGYETVGVLLDVDDVALRNAGFKRGADCGGKEGVEDVCDQRAV